MTFRSFSSEELLSLLKSRVEFAEEASREHKEELLRYLEVSFDRFIATLDLIKRYNPDGKAKILEIGPFPFFMTTAMIEFSDDEITGVSAPDGIWPGSSYQVAEKPVTINVPGKEYRFSCWTVNMEKEKLPLPDKTFDTVLCAEVIEHLVHNPAAMICEINRVLKDGGCLILTTPNGLYWKYLYNLFFYGSWEPYSKYGVYGRHNRLWAQGEIKNLLEGNGFSIVRSECGYAHSRAKKLEFASATRLNFVNLVQDMALVLFKLAVRIPIPLLKKKDGDQLYFVARKTGESKSYMAEYLKQINFIYEPKRGA